MFEAVFQIGWLLQTSDYNDPVSDSVTGGDIDS